MSQNFLPAGDFYSFILFILKPGLLHLYDIQVFAKKLGKFFLLS
jgi:hypothetical protein